MPIRIGSRIFDPRLFTTFLTIVLIAALLALGRWQLQRADAKRALDERFAAGADATRTIDRETLPLPRYQHIEASGAYDSARQVLIDNMSNGQGRAGYFVITPFALRGGGWILVNRGWVPLGASRADKPQITVPQNVRELHGQTDVLPRAGLQPANCKHSSFEVMKNGLEVSANHLSTNSLGGITLPPTSGAIIIIM